MVSFRLALSLLLTFGLAACGGGGSGEFESAVASSQLASLSRGVVIQGCVVDQYYIPKAAAVLARSSDGRLLNRVLSDGYGVFSMTVPASETVTIAIDKPDGDSLPVAPATEPRSVGACLLD